MDRQTVAFPVPVGASWRLKCITVSYDPHVVASVQAYPDLFFQVYDVDGRAFQFAPVLVRAVTTPGSGKPLGATSPINLDYPGGTAVRMDITGQDTGSSGPFPVSITLVGIRGWEGYGR